jgi:hypothetical protein
MSKNKGRDYTRLLMIGALLVIVIRYSAAFTASDVGEITGDLSTATTILMTISGIGMGFLVVFGQAYTFDGWRRSLPKSGQRWTWRFFLLTLVSAMLIIVDVAILVPFTVSRITHQSMDAVLGQGLTWWWSGVVNVAPALLLLGVMLGNQVVATQTGTAQSDRKVTDFTDNLPNGNKSDWRQVRKQLSQDDVTWLKTARTEEICFRYGINDRTARNWRKNAQAGKP